MKIQKNVLIYLSKYRYMDINKLANRLKINHVKLRRELKLFPLGLVVTEGNEVRLNDFIYNSTKEEILEIWGK